MCVHTSFVHGCLKLPLATPVLKLYALLGIIWWMLRLKLWYAESLIPLHKKFLHQKWANFFRSRVNILGFVALIPITLPHPISLPSPPLPPSSSPPFFSPHILPPPFLLLKSITKLIPFLSWRGKCLENLVIWHIGSRSTLDYFKRKTQYPVRQARREDLLSSQDPLGLRYTWTYFLKSSQQLWTPTCTSFPKAIHPRWR